jgi:hypothetical protein
MADITAKWFSAGVVYPALLTAVKIGYRRVKMIIQIAHIQWNLEAAHGKDSNR